MLPISRIVKYAFAISMMSMITNVIAIGAFERGCDTECNHHCHYRKARNVLFTANFNNWTGLTVVGTGSLTQEVVNITQGTKVLGNSINFSAATSQIVFPNPTLKIEAREGDVVFVSAFIELNLNSSIVSSQPLTAFTSDTKNLSTLQNTTLILPNIIQENTSANPIDIDNFSFVTIFRRS